MTSSLINKIRNLVKKNNIKKSNLLVKRYHKNHPFDENLQKYYLDILFHEKKFKEVTNNFLIFFKDTKDENTLKLFALSLSELKKFKDAETNFKYLVKISETAENFCLLAMSQYHNNKVDDSMKSYQKAIVLNNNNNAKIFINYANFLRDIDQNISAIKILEDYNSKIKNINILTLLIGINRDIQNHKKAIYYCLQAIDIEPSNAYFVLILATLKLEFGNKNEAIQHLNRSLILRPFLGPSHRLLSLLKVKY